MQEIVKKLTIEGGFFDSLLYHDYLYLWNIEGEQRVYNWQELFVRRNASDSKVVSAAELERYLLRTTDSPGKTLPLDTNVLNEKLYVATEDGLYRSDVFNSYEYKRREGKRPYKLWDARLFSINRHPQNMIMALSAGDDGLFEMNESAYKTEGLQEVERNIYRVDEHPSHHSEYWDASIGSQSRGNEYVANFEFRRVEKGFSTRNYIDLQTLTEIGEEMLMEPVNDEIGDVVRKGHVDGYDVIEFEDGLRILKNNVLMLSVNEPIVKWRIYGKKTKTIIILLDHKIEVYQNQEKVSSPDENETKEAILSYAKDIIKRMSAHYPSTINQVWMAYLFLVRYISRLQGIANIDFTDFDNWDRMTDVQMDYQNQILYIIKEWPRRFRDYDDEMSHRMVWGVDDCFVMAFKFSELNIYKDAPYPFVSLKGKRVSASKQRFLIMKKFGEIVKTFHHPFCNEYRIKGNAFVYNVKFFHTDAVCALLMGKDTGWSSMDSGRMLPILTMETYQKRLQSAKLKMNGLLEEYKNRPNEIDGNSRIKKALSALKRRVTEMVRLEMECRLRDSFDYDDEGGTDFGAMSQERIFIRLLELTNDDDVHYQLLEALELCCEEISTEVTEFQERVEYLIALADEYWGWLNDWLRNLGFKKKK